MSVWSTALPPLGGVLLGGAMTGFVQWQQRREDRHERRIDRLSDAVIDVQTEGVAWMRDAELLLNVIADSSGDELKAEIEDHHRFEAYTRSGARFQSAITRARLLVEGELYDALDALSTAFRNLGLSAFLAVAAEPGTDVVAATADGKKQLAEIHKLFNDFLRIAVRDVRRARDR